MLVNTGGYGKIEAGRNDVVASLDPNQIQPVWRSTMATANLSKSAQLEQQICQFWTKVNKNGPVHPVLKTRCWVWTASGIKGYGLTAFNGRVWRAHRLSWLLHTGRPPVHCILHKCDNRACCNPAHLFDGALEENVADMVAKNRQAKGERIASAKLTSLQAVTIRIRVANGEAKKAMAREYGVDPASIRSLIRGDTWRYAEDAVKNSNQNSGENK